MSMSCEVSPIISTAPGSTPSSSISSSSIAGCGLGVVSSAQREAEKQRLTPVASSERSSPRRLLPVAMASTRLCESCSRSCGMPGKGRIVSSRARKWRRYEAMNSG
jgi:hypothetical protein